MKCRFCVIAALLFLLTHRVSAQDQWLKKRFMPKAHAKFKLPTGEVPYSKLSFPLYVTKVNGDWLWVGKAWIKKGEVVGCQLHR